MFDNKDRQLIYRYKRKYKQYEKEYGEEAARIMIEGDIHKIMVERDNNEQEKQT